MKLKSNLKIAKDPILRLCLIVMGVCILLLGAIFAVTYSRTSYKALKDSVKLAQLNVDKATETVERHLNIIEVTAKNLASTRIRTYRDEEQIYSLLERFVVDAPGVWGIAVGYEPGIVPGKDSGFAPYVRHAGDTLEHIDLYAEGRDYKNSEWYKSTLTSGNELWSKPFRDIKGALIASYCIPLLDEDNNKIGVIAVDLQLDNFSDNLVKEIHPYEHSECMVLDEDLDFIAHPDHSLILTSFAKFVSEMAKIKSYTENKDIVSRIKNHETGFCTYADHTKHRGMLFFAAVEQTNWTVALTVPTRDVFKDSLTMARNMFFLCVSGIIILVLACAIIFKKIRKVVETKVGMEKELSMAHAIQMAMVKKVFPPYPERTDIDVYATLIPAKEVGGDLYDFAIHGDIFHFCIGDVSGKGVPASLFMATTRTLYRSIITRENSPAKIADALNDAISAENDENMFVTMYIGALNLKTGLLTVCNCGHNAPLTDADNGKMGYLTQPPTNIPVGVLEGFEYQEKAMQINRGFRIFIYTDGVTEAENAAHTLYGETNLEQELNASDSDARAEIERVLNSVKEHTKGYQQSDDITMLSVHYNPTKI